MTENESIEEIKKKICGERPTQHICSDGCMKGNDKCALSVAIKALEEVQQYRAIGTVEGLKSLKENGAFTGEELAQLAAMQMWLRDYEKIGTPEECRAAVEKQKTSYDVEKIAEQLEDYLFEKYCVEGDSKIYEIVKGGGVNE